MAHARASIVFMLCIAGAILVAGVVLYPLGKSRWNELKASRADERDFVPASDSDQAVIVRTLLKSLLKNRQCLPMEQECPSHPIYFDRVSATLRSMDQGESWSKYEVVTIRPEGSLFKRGDHWRPLPLQELLDNLSQIQTYNTDPALPGIIFVDSTDELQSLGEHGECNESLNPKLVRISRAAVQESAGIALALMSKTWCDGSGALEVAELRRDETRWRVISVF